MEKIPVKWSVNTIKTMITTIIKKNQGRILNIEEDIYIPVDKNNKH